jgi:dipeptidyl aminopeptidase/acylaminoacyl peptidase
LLAVAEPGSAQQMTAGDYGRAEQMLSWNAAQLVTGMTVIPRWLAGDRFWYRNRVRDGHEFVLVDPARAVRRPVFDHARLAAALSVAADTSYVPHKLPFREFEFTNDSIPQPPRDETESPDGQWVAFQRDENLWIRPTAGGDEIQLSQDGEPDYGYAVIAEQCCQEITVRRASVKRPPTVAWSPDSRRIATHKLDEREVGMFHLLETQTGRPKLHSYRYALPGDSVIPTFDMYVFDVETRSGMRFDQEPLIGDFASPDTTWAQVRWSPDGTRLFYTRRSRDFKELELVVGDASSGATRTILTERGPTLRETAPMIGAGNWRVVGDGSQVVWYSERDGWGHLYLVDTETGAIVNQITSGPWLVFDVLHIDESSRRIYFTAVGREAGRDPYYRHVYSAGLDGSGITLLTPEDADHGVLASPSSRFFVDTYSRRDQSPVTVVRDPGGRVVQTVETADITDLLATGWQPPTPFKVKGRDGVTDVYGYLYFPTDMDPEKQYPVVDYVYPGPQIGPVGLRGFSVGGWAGEHALPELGFIVFVIERLGRRARPPRTRIHRLRHRRLGDAGAIQSVPRRLLRKHGGQRDSRSHRCPAAPGPGVSPN